MHLVTAPVAGSGKSYLLSTVSYIATGQAMPVIGAGGSEEEMEERLGAAVIAGWPLICLDNMIGKLGGQALCQLVEQPRPHVRIRRPLTARPGRGARRRLFCQRQQRHGLRRRVPADPHQSAHPSGAPGIAQFQGQSGADDHGKSRRLHRGGAHRCRAYQAAGEPNRQAQIGSFNEWSDTVRSALVWLGEADPLKSMETARAEDPEANELQIMLDAWVREFGSGADNARHCRIRPTAATKPTIARIPGLNFPTARCVRPFSWSSRATSTSASRSPPHR